jgi:hypothetical protein
MVFLKHTAACSRLVNARPANSHPLGHAADVMDFEDPGNIKKDDLVIEYDEGAFKLVCDPKSLLYLFGLQLDYSNALGECLGGAARSWAALGHVPCWRCT